MALNTYTVVLLSTTCANDKNSALVFRNSTHNQSFQFHCYVMISHSASPFTLLYNSLKTEPFL